MANKKVCLIPTLLYVFIFLFNEMSGGNHDLKHPFCRKQDGAPFSVDKLPASDQ